MRAILPAEPSAVVPPTVHAAPCHVAVDCSQTSTDSGSSDRNRTQLGTVLLRSRRTRFKNGHGPSCLPERYVEFCARGPRHGASSQTEVTADASRSSERVSVGPSATPAGPS